MRREQYLPLVAPWDGVVREDWMSEFLLVYEASGLDIHKSALGPFCLHQRQAEASVLGP